MPAPPHKKNPKLSLTSTKAVSFCFQVFFFWKSHWSKLEHAHHGQAGKQKRGQVPSVLRGSLWDADSSRLERLMVSGHLPCRTSSVDQRLQLPFVTSRPPVSSTPSARPIAHNCLVVSKKKKRSDGVTAPLCRLYGQWNELKK